ncbi:40-residue YVTN family beta-propeller repeat-containing protein [Frankineae bacterium MT45]|nr:40-residue YVTN family beta-propeller repeat-containing protein [Frankineae bacterium MT45]
MKVFSIRRNTARRTRGLTVSAGVVLTVLAVGGAASAAVVAHAGGGFGQETVGTSNKNGILLPDNQRISPLGQRIEIDNGRLLSSTISPDGKTLAALSWNNFTGFLTLFDLKSGKVLQQIGTGATPADPTIGDGTVAADGPFYSPDGKSLWLPQTIDLERFAVQANGTVAAGPTSIAMTGTGSGEAGAYLPSGMAFTPDGKTAYVALNGADKLGVLDTTTNTLVKQIPVGVAPRQVAIVGGRVYVSNEGGRQATKNDVTNLTNTSTPVVANPSTGAVNNGTVSVVTPATGATSTIKVGLEPTALYANGTTLLVANSNDDSISLINTATGRVTQTVNVAPLPGSTVGSNPNSITMPDASHVLVTIGRDNAVAVFRFNGPTAPMQYEGLIPTDWYPVNVAMDKALGKLVVTNDKGIGARGPGSTISEGPDANVVTGHNTYDDTGTLTTFTPPTEAALGALTHQVFVNNDWQRLLASTPLAEAAKAAPVAIPTQLGQPSTIKHVFLLVKENRTYDQVLGDIGKGNGDPSLTQFGGSVTPNQHSLANQFGLFDNFYDEGTLSADGHNWLMQADANDYIEKEFGAFYRSYPAQGGDALAYQRDGFIWNAAQAAGKTVADFGEYANFQTLPATGGPTWADWYKASQVMEGKAAGPSPISDGQYPTYSDIPSLNAIIDQAYPKFNTDIPDQYRVDIWNKAFAQSEKTGKLANLNMLWVPDDHTAGTSGTDPYPTAQVADNDLAVGRIIDTISHSQFWKDSAIFVVEDDSQAGADHVDGHRAPLYVASPYAKRGVIDSTYYSQLNVVKTIEQILGIAPMNQEDRAAVAMTDAFTNKANLKPFTVMPNQIPLTYGLKAATPAAAAGANASANAAAAPAAAPSGKLASVQKQWSVWSTHQNFGGSQPAQDRANPAQLNRLDWYSATGWSKPYPGDKRILGPYEVPGWDMPAADLH